MDALLRWGIENSSQGNASAAPAGPREPLDPAIIDHILGKSDADQMKEQLAVALDESRDVEDRVTALDNFEMLVEQIDNANNLTPLDMWGSLIQLCKSSEDEVRQYGLWIIGTAIQNNPKAQREYLAYNPIPEVLAKLTSNQQTSAATRSKAIYCISNTLRHSARAVQGFEAHGGWGVLKAAIQDSSIVVRRKAVFLLLTLLLQDGPSSTPAPIQLPPSIHTTLAAPVPDVAETNTDGAASRAIVSSGILRSLLQSLVTPVPHGPDGDAEPDLDFEEKSVKVVLAFVQLGSATLDGDDRALLAKALEKTGKSQALEKWSLTTDEWTQLEKASR